MTDKTKTIRTINEWKTFQSESRRQLDSFISGKVSDVQYNNCSLDALYICLDQQELKLDLKLYIPVETVYVFSSVVDLISIKKLQGISNLVFSDCLLGELEIYESEIPKISFINCTIGFLDVMSLQSKSINFSDSHIDEINIIRSKIKRTKLVKTAIDLGNVDLCTFFKLLIKTCDIGQVFVGEALIPIIKIDDQSRLQTTISFLTYLKSIDLHENIFKYFKLGGFVCEETENYLEIKKSSLWVFDDCENGLMATFLNEFPRFLKHFNIEPSSMEIEVKYPAVGKVAISISKHVDKNKFYELFHAYTSFLMKSQGQSIFLEQILQDRILSEKIDENELFKDLSYQFKMFDPRFSKLESFIEVKKRIIACLEENKILIEYIDDLKLGITKLKLVNSLYEQKALQAAEYISGLTQVHTRFKTLRKVN
ncbi:MAG: hypothetical protein KC646_06940 [Candidatus Cloacimonetes bacterium]|nr:hypothetical protein [Candidatus Cloacimonadota bacterium]